jgi:4-alpha-glucanotransferase
MIEKNLRRLPGFGKKFRLDEHVIAENLGIITDEVEALREACGFPGMWILQFRFGAMDMLKPGFIPEGVEKNWTVYTGTHDNDTVRGWFDKLPDQLPPGAHGEFDFEHKRIREYLGTDGSEIHRDFVNLALRSPAKWALLPMQDVLGLGGEARMNVPGTTQGNWGWRFSEDMVTDKDIRWLKEATRSSGR